MPTMSDATFPCNLCGCDHEAVSYFTPMHFTKKCIQSMIEKATKPLEDRIKQLEDEAKKEEDK